MKVKMVTSKTASNLGKFVNEELESLKDNEVIDIKYAIDRIDLLSCQHYAMIIYK